jgi:pimeloyl-ACP methyl ester carboxylesterase
MPVTEAAGVELAYEDAGAGPPVVLVHGMAADRAAWDVVEGVRTIAYDRRGYGGSGAPEPYDRTTVAEQAEDLAALVGALGVDGAVAVGADFGALVVLDALLRHGGLLRAAVLVDPPAFPLVPDALEPMAAERRALEDALREGGPERAVERWLAARGVSDAERLERAHRDAAAFFADYGGLATLPLSRRELRAIRAPVAIVDSPHAPRHVRAAGEALAALLPRARREADPVTALRAVV